MISIDYLSVVNNEINLEWYLFFYELEQQLNKGQIKVNRKVSIKSDLASKLPSACKAFDFEAVSCDGSLHHAYNLHTLLYEIESPYFLIHDPDTMAITECYDSVFSDYVSRFDAFGTDILFGDFPSASFTVFNTNIFWSLLERYGLGDRVGKTVLKALTPTINDKDHRAMVQPKRPEEVVYDIVTSHRTGRYDDLYVLYKKKYENLNADIGWVLPVIYTREVNKDRIGLFKRYREHGRGTVYRSVDGNAAVWRHSRRDFRPSDIQEVRNYMSAGCQ